MSFVRTLFIVLPMVAAGLAVLIFVADRIHRRPIVGPAWSWAPSASCRCG